MVSLAVLFVGLLLNRISTPFQAMYNASHTKKEQQKYDFLRAFQLLGMLVGGWYCMSLPSLLGSVSGMLVVQIILGIALGIALGQVLEIFSVSHLRPTLSNGKAPCGVYDRWIWDTLCLVIFFVMHIKYGMHILYAIGGIFLYVVIPLLGQDYLQKRQKQISISMKSYKLGTMLWILAGILQVIAMTQ